jgi:hypothetical protein
MLGHRSARRMRHALHSQQRKQFHQQRNIPPRDPRRFHTRCYTRSRGGPVCLALCAMYASCCPSSLPAQRLTRLYLGMGHASAGRKKMPPARVGPPNYVLAARIEDLAWRRCKAPRSRSRIDRRPRRGSIRYSRGGLMFRASRPYIICACAWPLGVIDPSPKGI